MCGSCYDLLPAAPTKVCPLARCDYDRPPRHNLLAERQIAGGGLVLDCDNANHGCLFKGVVQELEEHLVECAEKEDDMSEEESEEDEESEEEKESEEEEENEEGEESEEDMEA